MNINTVVNALFQSYERLRGSLIDPKYYADDPDRFHCFRAYLINRDARQRSRIAELEAALEEISRGEGAFSRDPLTHAANTIDNMKSIALKALEKTGKR